MVPIPARSYFSTRHQYSPVIVSSPSGLRRSSHENIPLYQHRRVTIPISDGEPSIKKSRSSELAPSRSPVQPLRDTNNALSTKRTSESDSRAHHQQQRQQQRQQQQINYSKEPVNPFYINHGGNSLSQTSDRRPQTDRIYTPQTYLQSKDDKTRHDRRQDHEFPLNFGNEILQKPTYYDYLPNQQTEKPEKPEKPIIPPQLSGQNPATESKGSSSIPDVEMFEEDWPPEKEELELEKRINTLTERLGLYGLKEKTRIAADGNCQFAACSDQLYGTPAHHLTVRYAAVNWLRQNQDFVLPNQTKIRDFLQTDFFPTWEDYCTYMNQPGIWGDHLTLIAISQAFDAKIIIISSVEVNPGIDPFTVIAPRVTKRVLYLSHLHELHYSSLTLDNQDK